MTLLAVDADRVQAGWIALVFVVVLGVAMVLLYRSMTKHLNKVDFERPDDVARGDDTDGARPPTA